MSSYFKKWIFEKMIIWEEVFRKFQQQKIITKLNQFSGTTIDTSVSFGQDCHFDINGSPEKVVIKENFSCRRFCSFLVYPNSTLIIGNNVFFNNYCSVNCLERIEIGDNTIFGEAVKIYDHNHQYQFTPDLVVERNKFNTAPVCIGKNCWIGSNVTILKGVTIGDNVIVGANCLVYKSIPANTIVKSDSGFSVYTQ